MLHDVAAGMSYLHGRNHIHGDLRSPNLFVGSDGKVRGRQRVPLRARLAAACKGLLVSCCDSCSMLAQQHVVYKAAGSVTR